MIQETYRGTVTVQQCDHMGHMNVMYYVAKFDEGTWQFFSSLGITAEYMRDNECGMAAVQQNITYKRELLPGDVIVITTKLLEMRAKLLRFEHVMTNVLSGEVAAICEMTGVHLDRKARKAIPLPEDILARGKDKGMIEED